MSTRIGNRYAEAPNSRNATSANQAPAGPMRFVDGFVAAGDAERGIRRAVAQQREQEDQAQSGQHPERRLAQPFDARHEERLECGAGFGFIQVARQLIDLMR